MDLHSPSYSRYARSRDRLARGIEVTKALSQFFRLFPANSKFCQNPGLAPVRAKGNYFSLVWQSQVSSHLRRCRQYAFGGTSSNRKLSKMRPLEIMAVASSFHNSRTLNEVKGVRPEISQIVKKSGRRGLEPATPSLGNCTSIDNKQLLRS
jgi:hypothetical protein